LLSTSSTTAAVPVPTGSTDKQHQDHFNCFSTILSLISTVLGGSSVTPLL
jgi:hypothetical protein